MSEFVFNDTKDFVKWCLDLGFKKVVEELHEEDNVENVFDLAGNRLTGGHADFSLTTLCACIVHLDKVGLINRGALNENTSRSVPRVNKKSARP